MKNEINDIYVQIEDKILNHEIYQNIKNIQKLKKKRRHI